MEREYHIRLRWQDGQWEGVLSKDREAVEVTGLGMLVDLLNREAEQYVKELRCLAQTDALTGLFNRRGLEMILSERLEAMKGPIGVLFLDVDNLKRINDTWGHTRGDEALKTVAAVLKTTVEDDELVGRIGGDEFVVMFPEGRDEEVLLSIGKSICDEIRQTEQKIGLSVSVGVCLGKTPREYPDLLELADRAMYRAKRRGKDRVELYRDEAFHGNVT